VDRYSSLQWTLTTYSLPVSRRTETRPSALLRMRQAFEGIKKIPHPEEVAERPSRRRTALAQLVHTLKPAFNALSMSPSRSASASRPAEKRTSASLIPSSAARLGF